MNSTTALTKRALAIATVAAAAAIATAVPATADDHPTGMRPTSAHLQHGFGAGADDDHPTGGSDDHPTVADPR
ncbi:hypothetical protein [Streptomyces sp. ISL-11]|uniref:hypothetical protein n=1 Tax=Streptomyces sp. ISL-11 TaxID=2819174 RepID=UPI001BE8C179|nr:hypothetical protein [Streptomyces sp. ISL-11]MBT2384649.1 hypothetical protein [Streptomyces sp. ISL-11]